MKHRGSRLYRQVCWMSSILVGLTTLLGVGAALYFNLYFEAKRLDDSIYGTASVLAQNPQVIEALAGGSMSERYLDYLDVYLKNSVNLDVLTICDMSGTRIYHPNRERIGGSFSGGDEGEILAGSAPYITEAVGTLGWQRRAFQAVYDEDGRQTGFVMAAVLTKTIRRTRLVILGVFLAIGLLMLVLGMLLSFAMVRRFRQVLLGYEPEQLAQLFLKQADIFEAMDEGVVAVGRSGRIILANKAARQLTDGEIKPGAAVQDVFPQSRLADTVESGTAVYNIQMRLKDRTLLASNIPVRENGELAGAISILRDKTEVMSLAEQLTGANYLVETLRSFTHEFKNKLHVILGYIEMGHPEQASALILNQEIISSEAISAVAGRIRQQAVAALVIGKLLRAGELGIRLILQPGSFFTDDARIPADVLVTIIGNLVQNAMEELDACPDGVKEIELGIFCNAAGSFLTVDDTGRGISPEVADRITEAGVTTKGDGHGNGLALTARLVKDYEGELRLDSEAGEGTSVTVSF